MNDNDLEKLIDTFIRLGRRLEQLGDVMLEIYQDDGPEAVMAHRDWEDIYKETIEKYNKQIEESFRRLTDK